MTESDIYWTLVTCNQFAGSFFEALAAAGMKADPINRQRLLAAFPEISATYGPVSKMHQRLREGISA